MKNMTELETHEVQGGSPAALLTIGRTLLVAGLGATISGWSDFKQGFQDAFWHQQNLAAR